MPATSKLATSVCQANQNKAGLAPTDPCPGCSERVKGVGMGTSRRWNGTAVLSDNERAMAAWPVSRGAFR